MFKYMDIENEKNWFHIPTREYSPIDALNRRAAAIGSVGFAMGASHANYNGHFVSLRWNSYRKYYVAEYTWAGRNVIARGDFKGCLEAVLAENRRGALGASSFISCRDADAEALELCKATPELLPGMEPRGVMPSWHTWRHECAQESVRDSAGGRHQLVMYFDWPLMQSCESREQYVEALKAKHGKAYYL